MSNTQIQKIHPLHQVALNLNPKPDSSRGMKITNFSKQVGKVCLLVVDLLMYALLLHGLCLGGSAILIRPAYVNRVVTPQPAAHLRTQPSN
jgi:hypothetical protein